MNRSISVISGFLLLLISGCSTADQKIPEIAAGYCNCLSGLEKNLSTKTKEIFMKALSSPDPEKAMASETEKLNEQEKLTVGTELMTIGSLGKEGSKEYKCIADIDKKYQNERTRDLQKFQEKLIKELESKPGCSFTAAIFKAGLKLRHEEE